MGQDANDAVVEVVMAGSEGVVAGRGSGSGRGRKVAPAVDGPGAAAAVASGVPRAAAAVRQAAGEQSYVVQQRFLHPVEGGGEEVVWVDIAAVVVPARSKRSTIVRAALTSDGVVVSLPAEFRVLDAVAAKLVSVSERQRDPELVIG